MSGSTWLPWFLENAPSPGEAQVLLAAFTAVMAALCEDREGAGRSLPPQGLEGLVRTAMGIMGTAPDRLRVDLAFLQALEMLSS